MLNITMPIFPVATKTSHSPTSSRRGGSFEEEGAAAAELAVKAHVLRSDPEILAEMTKGDRMMREIADMINLTEAPEDGSAVQPEHEWHVFQ
jgi:hypothetical protein